MPEVINNEERIQKLRQAISEGRFYAVCEDHAFAPTNDLAVDWIQLQNKWGVNIAHELLSSLPVVASSGFWRVNSIVQDYLSKAHGVDVKSVIQLTVKMYNLCGQDLARGMILSALECYYKNNQQEIDAAFGIVFSAQDGEFLIAAPYVASASLAFDQIKYLRDILSWISNCKNDSQRYRIGLVCLCHANVPSMDEDLFSQTMSLIDDGAGSPDPDKQRAVYVACDGLLDSAIGSRRSKLSGIRKRLIKSGNPHVLLLLASKVIASADMAVNPDVVDLLDAALSLNPKYGAVLDNIDSVFYHLCSANRAGEALEWIEKYASIHEKDGFEIDECFPQFTRVVRHTREHERLDKFFTHCLLSGCVPLLRYVSKLVSKESEDEDLGIHAYFEQPPTQDALEQLFKIATGCCYHAFQTCLGYVLSVMELMDDDTLNKIRFDFYYLFCFNLPAHVESYIKAYGAAIQSPCMNFVKDCYDNAIKELKDFESLGSCPMLRPSIRHQEEYFQYRNDVGAKAQQKALENSLVGKLGLNSISMLHGDICVQYVKEPDGSLRRVDIKLQHHSFKMLVPNLVAYNSLSMDAKLCSMRWAAIGG